MKDQLETIMGVIYETHDGWATVYKRKPRRPGSRATKPVLVTDKDEADRIRYLAIAQSTSEAGRT